MYRVWHFARPTQCRTQARQEDNRCPQMQKGCDTFSGETRVQTGAGPGSTARVRSGDVSHTCTRDMRSRPSHHVRPVRYIMSDIDEERLQMLMELVNEEHPDLDLYT